MTQIRPQSDPYVDRSHQPTATERTTAVRWFGAQPRTDVLCEGIYGAGGITINLPGSIPSLQRVKVPTTVWTGWSGPHLR